MCPGCTWQLRPTVLSLSRSTERQEYVTAWPADRDAPGPGDGQPDQGLRRADRRLGRGRRHGGARAHRSRPRRAAAGGRPAGRLRDGGALDGVALRSSAPRQARARHLRAQRVGLQAAQAALRAVARPLHQRHELAATRRGTGLHQAVLRQREGASLYRHQLLLGALPRPRRQDQCVGPAFASSLRLRLQGGEPRRLRRRLADLLRRRLALLRQGRPLSRHFRRDGEPAVAAGLDLPAADALNPAEVHMRQRAARQERLGGHAVPSRRHHRRPRPQQVSLALLRPRRLLPPRRRLRHSCRLQFADRPDLSGLGHRPAHGPHQLDRPPGADGSRTPARPQASPSSTPQRRRPTRPRPR